MFSRGSRVNISMIFLMFVFQAGSSRLIKNFSEDIKDSEIYTELLAQVAPRDFNVDKCALTREVGNDIISIGIQGKKIQ